MRGMFNYFNFNIELQKVETVKYWHNPALLGAAIGWAASDTRGTGTLDGANNRLTNS